MIAENRGTEASRATHTHVVISPVSQPTGDVFVSLSGPRHVFNNQNVILSNYPSARTVGIYLLLVMDPSIDAIVCELVHL